MMDDAIRHLASLLNNIGLVYNPEKSQRFISVNPMLESLGTFIGDDANTSIWIRNKCLEFGRSNYLLKSLDPHLALPILQFCINSRPMYLARTSPPWISYDSLASFDQSVDDIIATLCNSNGLELVSSLIRSQPRYLGGLGIPNLHDVCDKAWIASFTYALKSLCQFCPSLCQLFEFYRAKNPSWFADILSVAKKHCPDVVCMTRDNQESLIFWNDPASTGNHYTCKKQRSLCEDIVKDRNERIVETLKANGDKAGLNWFLSNGFLGSGSWISYSSFSVDAGFSSNHFRVNLSRRLLIHPPSVAVNPDLLCTLCNTKKVDDRFHRVSCNSLAGLTKKRHDLIVLDLFKTLKNLLKSPGLVDHEVLLNNDSEMKMDVVATIQGIAYFVDITIVNPSSRSHLIGNCLGSPKLVTQMSENAKKRKYAKVLSRLGVNADTQFIPFAICSSGFMGQAAKHWFEYVANLPGYGIATKRLCWYKLACHRLVTTVGLLDETCRCML